MGRQAYGIVGGIIGAVVVGIATDGTATAQGYEAGFAVGAAVGGIAGSYIDPLVIQGNKIGDNALQVAAEGGVRAMMYGRACVTATCVLARGNRKVTKKKESNGKGSSGSTSNEYVSWTFAIGLGEAIVGGSITRIWQDDNLVYDVLADGAINVDDNGSFAEKFKFYDGSEDQLPDPDLQVFLAEQTPYFRGTAYVVFPNFDLTKTAERIPQFKFEITQGVVGIVDEIETLSFDFPNTGPGLPNSDQSVTLTGSSADVWNVDLYFTGNMETRHYTDGAVVVGANGRFVTAMSSTSSDYPNHNIYRITISDPPQTYYINQFVGAETHPIQIFPDGSDDWKMSVKMAGNATIEFFASSIDGLSDFGPQHVDCRAEILGLEGGANSTIPLYKIVDDVLKKSGMSEDQFDTSALIDPVAGVCIQETASGAAAVGTIVSPFFADPTENDFKLVWVKRGGDVLRTLTIDDLTEDPDVAVRENSIEYPAKLSFFYQSPLTGYATTKATSYRYSPQANSSGEGSVTAPVTYYDSDQPAQIAQKLHKVAWTEAEGTFTWKVGLQCIDLLPGDVLGLYLRGVVNRARITAIENDGNTLTLTLIKDRQNNYTSNVTGIPLPLPTPPQPATMSKAVLGVLDIPALQDTDDTLNYYTAMSGSTRVWQGGQLQRSLDGGATWTAIGEVATDTTMGRLTAAMTAASPFYTDTTNTVVVQLFDSNNTLPSYSETAFNQEQGAIALQLSDGTWEVLQYQNATDGGNGLYTLDTLKRGRLTTTAGAHDVGALFVKLDQYLVKNAAQTSYLDGTMKHRAVSYTLKSADADVVTTVYHGNSQLEWTPASATVEYDGSVVAVSDIVPRHRFGTEVNPVASTNFIGFRITATDGTQTATVDTSTNGALLAFNGTPSSVTVAAVNRITDAGPALTVTEFNVAPARDAVVTITQPGATATDGNRQVIWIEWAGYPSDSSWAPPLGTDFSIFVTKRGSDDSGTGSVLIYAELVTTVTAYDADDTTRYNVVGGVGSGPHSSLAAGATAAGVDILGYSRSDDNLPTDACASWDDSDVPTWAHWAITLPKGEVCVVQPNPGDGMPVPGYSQWAIYATSLPGDSSAASGSLRSYYSPTTQIKMAAAPGFVAKIPTSLPQIAQVDFLRSTVLPGVVLSVTVTGPNLPGSGGNTSDDAHWSNVSLLLHFDGVDGDVTTTDYGPLGLTVTNAGTALLSSTQAKFGPTSMGNTGNMSAPGFLVTDDASLDFGSADWSVEGWYWRNLDGFSQNRLLWGKFHDNTSAIAQGIYLALLESGEMSMAFTSDDGVTHHYNWTWPVDGATPFGHDVWCFVQLVRNGNTVHLYVNGDEWSTSGVSGVIAGADVTGMTLLTTSDPLSIGCTPSPADAGPWNGHIDEFRVTKGYARAASVPTTYFPTTATPSLPAPPRTYSYTTISGDTLTSSLTSLAGVVNADSDAVVTASVGSGVLVLTGKTVSVAIDITGQSSGHVLGTP